MHKIYRLSSLVFTAILFLSLMEISSGTVYAQEYLNANLVQPDVWSYPGVPDAGVSPDGSLGLQVPIMTVPGRGIDFDIVFSYNSNVTVDQQASWIGLGWSFDPGSISREAQGGGRWVNGGETFYYGIDKFDNQTGSSNFDPGQPDIYYIHIPGRGSLQMTQAAVATAAFNNGTVPVMGVNSFVVDHHRSWKIVTTESTGPVNPCSIYAGTSPGACDTSANAEETSYADYESFTVTTEDGVRYIFEAPSLGQFTTSEGLFTSSISIQNYINTWRIRAILGTNYVGNSIPDPSVNPSGEWILFEYTHIDQGDIDDDHFVQTRHLASIITPTHEAIFVTSGRNQENFPSFTNEPPGQGFLYKRLDRIVLQNRLVTTNVKKVELDFISDGFGPHISTLNRRLGLASLTFQDGEVPANDIYSFDFDYGYNCKLAGNSPFSPYVEDFGYLNPQTAPSGTGNDCPSNELPEAWRLTQIMYPMGGAEEYAYELDAVNTTGPAPTTTKLINGSSSTVSYSLTANFGGSRVQSITRDAGMGAGNQVTNYDYGVGYVTGVPYRFLPTLTSGSADKVFVPSGRGAVHVSYASVKQSGVGGGSVETLYTSPAAPGGYAVPQLKSVVQIYADGSGTIHGIVLANSNEDMDWGKEYKRIVRDDANKFVQITEYDLHLASAKMADAWPPSVAFVPVAFSQSHTNKITVKSCPPIASTESTCDVSKTTTYTYDKASNGSSVTTATNQVVDVKEESQNVIRHTYTDHAFHTYSGMKDANMLSQIYATTVCEGTAAGNETDCTNTPHFAKNWTIWGTDTENEPVSYWRPREEYAWLPDDPGDTSAPASYVSAEAELVATYSEYNLHGNIEKYTDARSVTHRVDWGYNSSLPKALIDNAEASEYFVDGFDEDLSAWTQYDADGDGKTRWSIQNGKLELIHNGNAENYEFDRIFRDLGQTLTTGQVVVEFDLTIADSDNNDLLIVLSTTGWVSSVWAVIKDETYKFYHPKTGGGYQWTTIKSGLQVGQTYQVKIVADVVSKTVDYYVDGEKLIDDGLFYQDPTGIRRVQFRNYGLGSVTTKWYIDNVRIYPADAQVTSATYDDETLQMTSLVDVNGTASYFEYDSAQRLVQTLSAENIPAGNHSYYLSRTENGGNFNSNDPNYVQSAAMQAEPLIPDWSLELTKSSNKYTDWTRKVFSSNNGTSSLDTTEAKVGVRSIKASVSGSQRVLWEYWPSGGIPVDDSKLYHIGLWAKTDNNYSGGAFFKVYFKDENGTPVNSPPVWIEIPAGDRDWTLYSETFELPQGAVIIYAEYLNWSGTGSSTGTIWWDAAQFQPAPIAARAYSDGLGRPIQSQQFVEGSSIYTATDYDNLGRPTKAWAPYLVNSLGGYDQNHSNSATTYFTNNGYTHNNRPYVETEYEDDPLQRPSIVHPPGISSNSNSERLSYGTELINAFRYFYTESEDEDERKNRTHVDAFGNTIRSTAGVGSSNPAVTQFVYDELDQLEQVTSPQGYNTYYHYDQRGRLIGKTTPDASGDGDSDPAEENSVYAGDYQYKYDIAGNLRFAQDPNLRNPGDDFIYYRYDDLNRLTEVGLYTGGTGFNSSTVTNNLNNQNWPSSNTTAKATYLYEGSVLSRVDTWEGSSHDYAEYDYDNFGRVRTMKATIAGLGSKTTTYEYDVQGKLKKVNYQDGQSDAFYTWYAYDAGGRLAEVKTNTSNNEGSATREAAYTYWADGSVKQQLLGPDPSGTPTAVQAVDYRYNIRGSLLSINGSFSDLTDANSLGGDAFAMDLGYEDVSSEIAALSGVDKEARYNGNISWLAWKTKENNFASDKAGYVFKYDQHDRLVKADFAVKYTNWTNQARYDVGVNQTNGIEYFDNGNIHKLHRNNESNVGSLATYGYLTNSNRLDYVSGGSFAGNFNYDPNGNVLSASGVGISSSTYDYRNLPTNVNSDSYRYDADGNRIYNSGGDGSYYVRGAGGEVIAVYKGNGTLLYNNILAGGRVIGKIIR